MASAKTAREVRDASRSDRERRKEVQTYDGDIRALRRLIKFYTARRDWFMVERLNNDLGRLLHWREAKHLELFKTKGSFE